MNAPALFQSSMEHCFQEYKDHKNILVYSKNFNSYIKHLWLTLQQLRQYGVKVKAKNCYLFCPEVWYLGRTVLADGYKLDPNNVKAATDLLKHKPETAGIIGQGLQIVGFFRRYISPGFSKTVLYQLLKKRDMKTSSKTFVI